MIGQRVSDEELARSEAVDRFFRDVYPEDLSGRLSWFEREFGLSRCRMLRLAGLAVEDSAANARHDWAYLCKHYPEPCRVLESLLFRYLESFRYDPRSAAEALRSEPDRSGRSDRTPDGWSEDDAAVVRIHADAPGALTDLTGFLARSLPEARSGVAAVPQSKPPAKPSASKGKRTKKRP